MQWQGHAQRSKARHRPAINRYVGMLGLLPCIEEDETLYSFCATAHSLSGFRSSEKSSILLLGITHGAKQHDLPSKVPLGLLRGVGSVRDVLDCLRRHTVAALYLPFLSEPEQLEAAARFARGEKHARRRLDGSSRSLCAPHALKACAACVAEDKARLGRAYWHVVHQLPSCLTCPKHCEALWSRSTRLRTWCLPDLLAVGASTGGDTDGLDIARQTLSCITDDFCRVKTVDTDLLRAAVVRILRQMSVMHDGRSVHVEQLANWFSSTGVASALRQMGGWGHELSTGHWVASQLWRRKQDHAVRWAVLWAALDWPSIEHASFALKAALLDTPVDESGQMGLFPVSESPMQTPLRIREALECCLSYEEVQARLGITRTTLLRWLELEPKLRVEWKLRKKTDRIELAVREASSFARSFPLASPTDLEGALPSHVRFLRKHATEKLRGITSTLQSRLPAQLKLAF